MVQVDKPLVLCPRAHPWGDMMRARSRVLHEELDTPQMRNQDKNNISLLMKGEVRNFPLPPWKSNGTES